jgi:hypothetical protein
MLWGLSMGVFAFAFLLSLDCITADSLGSFLLFVASEIQGSCSLELNQAIEDLGN